MGYRVGSVKKNLKPFKAWLHYGDSAHPPMHTASFHGNQYDLNVLIRQAEAEGEPLRVQKEPSSRRAGKRKSAGRSKPKRHAKKRRTVTRLRRVATKKRSAKRPRSQYKIVWDNGHATGTLPYVFDTRAKANTAGEDWRMEMVAMEPPEDRAEAEEAYSFDVVEVPRDDEPWEDEMALLRKAGLSRGQP